MSENSTTLGDRIGTLRGAGVAAVDGRRLGIAAVTVCLLALAVLSVSLFVAGAHKNAQISNLRQRGVPVTVTSTGCTGLLGGSGSNPVGYACRGTYTVAGHRYQENIPGTALHAPGTTVAAVVDPADPSLLATATQISAERPSGRVYIVPAVLLGALVALCAALAVGHRRSKRRPALPPHRVAAAS